MKWFLVASICLLCSASWARGDAAADLYNKGITELQGEQYVDAGKDFDTIIANYPSTPNLDDVRIRAGFAYLHAGKFAEAVARLAKQAADNAKPEYQATALYFTGMAEFSQGQKSNDKTAFQQAALTLTTLIDLINTKPTAGNTGFLETSLYYRALAQYARDDYDDAEKDLIQLTQDPQFGASLVRPDYLLRLGSIYALETNQALEAKKSSDDVHALADKALKAFDRVSSDPNALVQANEANMSKGEILFLLAQLDATPAGYEKPLEAFRQVHRKDDMIPLQQKRLEQLRTRAQEQARASLTLSTFTNDLSLLLAREENRLKDLQSGADPIIQALIRMAECYIAMKQPDEARTILHRLVAHAPLTPDQQQEVDFQMLYSYVLGGQIDQADKALDDYLAKHAGDPQADSISVAIGEKMLNEKNYAGALEQALRSLKDFPKGRYTDDATVLQAQALTRLGRIAESAKVVDDFLTANPTSPKANNLLISRAQNETSQGNLTAALADYKKVKDNDSAGADLQAAADAGYIQTLQSLKKFDEVITEAQAFVTKYPDNNAMPSVMLINAMALDRKHDPGAVAALQAVAQKFPKNETAPFALYYIVNIYQRANNVPAMIQAANDLRKGYPEAYSFLVQAADAVSAISIKQKKFDDAIALFQPLVDVPKADVAAMARNKIGAVWLLAAKALGAYQSMSVATRAEAEKRLSNAEQAYLGTLKKIPDQLDAVGDAIDGLIAATERRRSWGLLKDADMEGQLTKLGADLTTPDMQARLELAKAGLVFDYKDGVKQYPAALERFKKVIAANPSLRLTRQETDQFGELLLAAKDYSTALKIYNDLLTNAAPYDQVAHADAYYGLGATNLGEGNLSQAKDYFLKMKAMDALWHPHILDANYGIALADEQTNQPADSEEAKQIYAGLMQVAQGGVALQAKAMLGYGRLLEKAGHAIQPAPEGPNEYAVHYYLEAHILFGPATPEQSAEGLFDAGQVYEKAGDKANAKKQYDTLLKIYGTTAPDWAAKAQAAEAKLGP